MAKRRVLQIPGLAGHGRIPIPTAIQIGNQVFTGSIAGQDPTTVQTPDAPEQQMAHTFANMRRIVEAAGGTTDDIAKVEVRLKDMALRELLDQEWVRMFPDADNRPVRHTSQANLPANLVVQLEMTAVL